jgi:hypothetical protein
MPISAYGTTNPRGLEPWPIETTLAPLAVGNSQAEAQTMLENYQQQRDAAANVYSGDLDQQHQFAYDQLRQQMAENYMKALPENAKAGTLDIFAQQNPGAVSNVAPGTIADTIARANLGQAAETYSKAGTGFNQFAQGGFQTAPGSVPGMAGVPGVLTDPALVRAATIRGQYGLAAAGLNANKPSPTTVSTPLPPDADGTVHTITTSKVPADQVTGIIDAHNQVKQGILDRRAGVTSLPPAQNQTSQTTTTSALDTSSPAGKQAQTAATMKMQRATDAAAKGDPAAKAMVDDVRGAMKGQVFTIVPGPGGQPVLKGRAGNYALGN